MILIKTYRDAFHGLNRETWLLSLVIFINRCGTMAIPLRRLWFAHIKDSPEYTRRNWWSKNMAYFATYNPGA